MRLGSVYGQRLMLLHGERRLLIVGLEQARARGVCTDTWEAALKTNNAETRRFLAYLDTHARN